jgi:type I restriction enzyme, S subunit
MDSTPRAEWTETAIGNVIDIFDSKRIPLSGSVRKQRQGQYPYYGASGVIDHIDDYIFDGRYLLIAEDGENLNSRKLPVAFFAKGKFWVNNHAHIVRAKADVADDNFLFSWFAQANISGYITGAAQPKLSQENLKRIELRMPSLLTQQKISAILSAYDDLIENNLRRIKILEEMAQNLYREWFVKFRFPGHERARFIDSPLGRIPDGWEVAKVGDILKKIKRGTKIQKHDYVEEGLIPVVDQGKEFIGGYSNNTESLNSDDLPLIVFGDHTRALKFIDFPFACGADGTQLLKSNNARMPMTLFYYTLLSIDLSNYAYARHFKFLKEETLILPETIIADYYDHFVSPLREQISKLMQKNTTLRHTCDLLLPKLISGEVDVSELDITIHEEAV